jgi:hypothetical protein
MLRDTGDTDVGDATASSYRRLMVVSWCCTAALAALAPGEWRGAAKADFVLL